MSGFRHSKRSQMHDLDRAWSAHRQCPSSLAEGAGGGLALIPGPGAGTSCFPGEALGCLFTPSVLAAAAG